MKSRILISFASLLTLNLFSQDFKASLRKIESSYQNCLNDGKHMYNCSSEFYKQADSLLNVVYRHIRKDMNLSEKENLKKEQLVWLKERDNHFNRINNQNTELGDGLDDLMIKSDKKAKIVNDRTTYLIEKFISQKESTTINFKEVAKSLDESSLSTICTFLDIRLEDIDLDKSSSLKYDVENIFYVITYKSEKDTEFGNYFETYFLIVNTKRKDITKSLKFKQVSYYDEEAGQPDKIQISSDLITLDFENKVIALMYGISVGGCANAYTSDNLVLIAPRKDSFIEILKPFHLNRTIYEGNCNGDYSLEKQNSSIKIVENEENKYDLKITTEIKYEINKESTPLNGEEENYSENSKSIIRLVQANDNKKYDIEELPYFFFGN